MVKKLTWFLVLFSFLACSNKYQEIPLDELPKDLKSIADETANHIVKFCDDPEAFEKFKLRSSLKSFLHLKTGKHLLVCYIYENEVNEIAIDSLYKVHRLKANVKRFKYKLTIVSDMYDRMEIHVDLNSDKNIADYKIYGKRKGESEWISIIDELNLEVMKAVNRNK
ncbi:hypothetical protein [Aquimarina litoralis]|uniref:hypothetical protein n=1 Tax=Aquimarina litoralis TaxID=584605 RepID=UPI001C55E14F|nr:hypothetical protein [Aquimarina litoralis]MBW1296718.1 hypothetical protein [Aquimarina litoralis]